MSKKLTPLEASKQLKDFVLEFVKNGLDRRFIRGSFDIIESALKRLDTLEKWFFDDKDYKNKRALEIIKEKKVNVGLLSRCATVERYNKGVCYEPRQLTQDQYDLLKEVLL